MNFAVAEQKLKEIGQEHVLKYYDELSEDEKNALLEQIGNTDFSVLSHVNDDAEEKAHGVYSPLKAVTRDEILKRYDEFTAKGIETIKAGKTAALLLAGGMGTRLGSDNPKGMYDIGLTKHVYIFQRIIENLLDTVHAADTWIYLFIMTSEKNDTATRTFMKEHDYFGYNPDYIRFFKQDMAPACDFDGKLYMESKSRIATSPNGNGGWYTSLVRAGLDGILNKNGIEWINVFAVDNVLQKILSPGFVGACVLSNASVGSKVVRKASPDEKVGVMCLEDGKPSIVEYYELSDEMRDAKDENGEPAYNFGVILNYLFHVPELYEVASKSLPLHRVTKKINHIDSDGNFVKPTEPNGYKFEQLVLDMIHEMYNCLPYEVIRENEFAPIKNKEGVDSVESARELLKKNGYEL